MKKSATLHAEIKRNWNDNKYILFYTDDFNLAEIDYPIEENAFFAEERKKPRVYPVFHDNYFEYDTMKTALAVTETIIDIFLAQKGYEITEFDYPEELNEIKNEK